MPLVLQLAACTQLDKSMAAAAAELVMMLGQHLTCSINTTEIHTFNTGPTPGLLTLHTTWWFWIATFRCAWIWSRSFLDILAAFGRLPGPRNDQKWTQIARPQNKVPGFTSRNLGGTKQSGSLDGTLRPLTGTSPKRPKSNAVCSQTSQRWSQSFPASGDFNSDSSWRLFCSKSKHKLHPCHEDVFSNWLEARMSKRYQCAVNYILREVKIWMG